MRHPKPKPVESLENLRVRIERLLKVKSKPTKWADGGSLSLFDAYEESLKIERPGDSVAEFLDFLTAALPDGDVYLFGGVVRDMALFGKRGFDSDIDLVVDGAWSNCVSYLEFRGAIRNKFGGYRLDVGEWPVDIWNAKETWAVKVGLVSYKGVASLTKTTVLNWDAILMNWRTKSFVCESDYLEHLKHRILDIVLEENPNPLGMAVRVFRHLFLKDAATITNRAARYLANCARTYSYDDLKQSELASYNNSVIDERVYRVFSHLKSYEELEVRQGFSIAMDLLRMELDLSHHRAKH